MIGVPLKRDSQQQVEVGETINFVNEAKAGDLAFFDNADEKITHVGIIIDNKQIIHASGEVRIDTIDHQGIYNEKRKIYTHKLRIIKRIIVDPK
jgi:cell wall-associated NlpC family hydrolase